MNSPNDNFNVKEISIPQLIPANFCARNCSLCLTTDLINFEIREIYCAKKIYDRHWCWLMHVFVKGYLRADPFSSEKRELINNGNNDSISLMIICVWRITFFFLLACRVLYSCHHKETWCGCRNNLWASLFMHFENGCLLITGRALTFWAILAVSSFPESHEVSKKKNKR